MGDPRLTPERLIELNNSAYVLIKFLELLDTIKFEDKSTLEAWL